MRYKGTPICLVSLLKSFCPDKGCPLVHPPDDKLPDTSRVTIKPDDLCLQLPRVL